MSIHERRVSEGMKGGGARFTCIHIGFSVPWIVGWGVGMPRGFASMDRMRTPPF